MRNEWANSYVAKFDSPLTAYIYDRVIMASGQDEDAYDGQGNSVARIGRRLVWEDDRGFVSMTKEPTERQAASVVWDALVAWGAVEGGEDDE